MSARRRDVMLPRGVAVLRAYVSTTAKSPDGGEVGKSNMTDKQLQLPGSELIGDLRKDGPEAAITVSRVERVSHAEYWGQGAWDKIPYTVEVGCNVTLVCDQTDAGLTTAHSLADDIAAVCTRRSMQRALMEASEFIRGSAFPDLFGGSDE